MSIDTLSKLREEKYRERHKRRQERKQAVIRENGRRNRRMIIAKILSVILPIGAGDFMGAVLALISAE